MNNDWDKDGLNSPDLSKIVTYIHICGYKNIENAGDDEGNPPTNHWASFLQLQNGGSVRLDMIPGYGSDGQRGKLVVSSKPYDSTDNSIKTVTFSTLNAPTAKTITDLITQNGRERYNFTEVWEGCRFWIYTLISDLETAGIVSAGSRQETWEAVSNYWRYPSGSEPRTVARGAFR